MSKELEALNLIRENLTNKTFRFNLVECLDVIENGIKRLEGFDKTYEDVKSLPFEEILDVYKDDLVIDILINAYEKLKQALSIIKEKNVNIKALKHYSNYKMYNSNVNKDEELTEEEFELLKS